MSALETSKLVWDWLSKVNEGVSTKLAVPQYKLGPVTFNNTDHPVNANLKVRYID